MYVNKNFDLKGIIGFSGGHLVWLSLWASVVTVFIEVLHHFAHLGYNVPDLQVPYLPISVVGTAVAFYVGFKNNSAYDRLWEARKIWGGIVNVSRMWGTNVRSYVSNQFSLNNIDSKILEEEQKRLIYRHIAWIYTLRSQLLIPTAWEHIKQNRHVKKATEKRYKTFGVGLYDDEITQLELRMFLPKCEYEKVIEYSNTATQLIDSQSQDLKELRQKGLIDDFRHMELQKLLNEFLTFQGQCERIKKFPLPRQYGSMSLIFTGVFIFLLPFGMVTVFHELGEWGAWLSIPFTILVGWIFIMMELIGDYSENPFEGLGNDIPMLSLCRTIEIDLCEMLGDTNIPPAIEAKNGVLM